MKQARNFVAGVALSLFAFWPAIAAADQDELDVTMEVLDDIGDIDGDVIVMPGPEDDVEGSDGVDREDGESADDADASQRDSGEGADIERDFAGDEFGDDFTHDEDFEFDDDEEHSEQESDFDEGEQIDLDEPDEVPMEEDEPMHDEEQLEGGEM